MTAMTKETETKTKKPIWYPMIAGALFGFTSVYIGKDLISGGANGESLFDQINVSQIAALFVAFVLFVCAAMVAIGFASPKAGIAMKMIEDRDQWEDERTMMWLSVVGCASYAAVMVMLALAEPFGLVQSLPALIAIGILAVIFCYTGWRLLREYDELWQGVNSETCTYGMYLTLFIGGTWSVLAQLKFIPALSPLDWITLLTAACLIGAILSSQRRGMLDD